MSRKPATAKPLVLLAALTSPAAYAVEPQIPAITATIATDFAVLMHRE